MKSKYKVIRVMMDDETYKMLNDLSLKYEVSKAEVVRAAIVNSELTLNCRERGEIIANTRKGIIDKFLNCTSYYFDEEVIAKLKKMRMTNDAAIAEIIRTLITTTDFSKLKLRSQGEILSEKKGLNQQNRTTQTRQATNLKKFGIILDTITNKKIMDFSIANDVSCAEIIRVLIDQTDPNMRVKSRAEMVEEFRKRGTPRELSYLSVSIDIETAKKMQLMKFNLKTTYSEIARTLITNADLSKLNIRTKTQVMSDALKGKNTGKVYNVKNRKKPSKNAPLIITNETQQPTDNQIQDTPEQPETIS